MDNPEAPEGSGDEEEGSFEEWTVIEAVIFSDEGEVDDRDDEPDHEEGPVEEGVEAEVDESHMHCEGNEGVREQSGEAGGNGASKGDEEDDGKGEGFRQVALIKGKADEEEGEREEDAGEEMERKGVVGRGFFFAEEDEGDGDEEGEGSGDEKGLVRESWKGKEADECDEGGEVDDDEGIEGVGPEFFAQGQSGGDGSDDSKSEDAVGVGPSGHESEDEKGDGDDGGDGSSGMEVGGTVRAVGESMECSHGEPADDSEDQGDGGDVGERSGGEGEAGEDSDDPGCSNF